MTKSRERSTWVWSCWKMQRRSVCGVKSLKPGNITVRFKILSAARKWAHLQIAFDQMAFTNIVSMGKYIYLICSSNDSLVVSQKLSFCSWILAGPSLLLCWHLIAITLQASTLPLWVILPLSHHSLPHLCVPGYSLSLSGRALMSMSIRVWHCVIQTCIWWMWIKFERIRSSGKSCFLLLPHNN